uniref:Transglutaminase n=1 Tax=Oryza sativa TaxID=4530 RepID=M1VT12_ORYSA|nr:transglutaminase [Oryza sativa]CBX55063.1 transglutaminase [Oryza sativa]
MAYHGQLDGRQASGLMRDGAFPAASLSGRQPLDRAATALEILEKKLAEQTAEAEKLIRENQRLASSHVVLRQDIVDTEKEMQMIRAHLGDVQTETDMHMRDLMERMRLMEADIQAGDAVKKELHQVHMEAKRLIAERQMLTVEMDKVTKELHKFSGDSKKLPELLTELDGLRKEHQSLRSAFEYEKNTNIKQVEQMRTMEMNLMTMTKEADKLRADVANAEKRAQVAAAQAVAAQAGVAHVTASQPGQHKLWQCQLPQTHIQVHLPVIPLHITKEPPKLGFISKGPPKLGHISKDLPKLGHMLTQLMMPLLLTRCMLRKQMHTRAILVIQLQGTHRPLCPVILVRMLHRSNQ